MSFQDDAGNYTMISHALAQEVGLVCAAVYGAVWRYCQMEEGICRASLNTIAKDINLNRATVLRSIEKLSDLGYLIDQTPDRRNAPHTYVTGRTVVMCNSLEQYAPTERIKTVAESNTNESQTVAQDNTTVAHNNSSTITVAQDNTTVAESYLNRVFNKESKDSKEFLPKQAQPQKESKKILASPEKQKLFLILARLCHIDLKTASQKQIGQLDNSTVALLDRIGDPDIFQEKFNIYWLTVDWRGKQGQSPLPIQIRESYGDYCHWLENGHKNGNQQKVSISAK